MENRYKALEWWDTLPFYKRKNLCQSIFGKDRFFATLTGREIEVLYNDYFDLTKKEHEVVGEHRTFTDTGDFLFEEKFEEIWFSENVTNDWNVTHQLNDDEYLDYKIWCEMNRHALYKRHLPNAFLFSGDTFNVVFHGGCLGCTSQQLNGFERCMGCKYFRSNWDLPDLFIYE